MFLPFVVVAFLAYKKGCLPESDLYILNMWFILIIPYYTKWDNSSLSLP